MKRILIFIGVVLPLICCAQNNSVFPSLSPKGEITQMVGTTKLRIEYERPSVRKRKIFGELVPFHKVWRTGAGLCTRISFDKRVIIGKQQIDAGKYSLFTIPSEDQWIVMLNRDTTLYGHGFYDSQKDVIRFIVKPEETHRFYETLTIDVDLIPPRLKLVLILKLLQIKKLIILYPKNYSTTIVKFQMTMLRQPTIYSLGIEIF